MRSPKRLYSASHIANGVQTVAKLQQKVLEIDPMAAGPMRALKPPPAPAGQEEPPEQMDGYCIGCKTKRNFTVADRKPLPNGAVLHTGVSNHPDCSHTVTRIVSKEKTRGAA